VVDVVVDAGPVIEVEVEVDVEVEVEVRRLGGSVVVVLLRFKAAFGAVVGSTELFKVVLVAGEFAGLIVFGELGFEMETPLVTGSGLEVDVVELVVEVSEA
jgi:hypothetical protein